MKSIRCNTTTNGLDGDDDDDGTEHVDTPEQQAASVAVARSDDGDSEAAHGYGLDGDGGTEHVGSHEEQAAIVAVAGSDGDDNTEAAHGCGFDGDTTEHVVIIEQHAAAVAVSVSSDGDNEAAPGCGSDGDTTKHVVTTEQHTAAVAVSVSGDDVGAVGINHDSGAARSGLEDGYEDGVGVTPPARHSGRRDLWPRQYDTVVILGQQRLRPRRLSMELDSTSDFETASVLSHKFLMSFLFLPYFFHAFSFLFLAYFFLISKLPNFQISIRTIIPNFQTSKVWT